MSDPDTVAAQRFAAEASYAFRFLHDELGFDGPSVDYPSIAVWVIFEGTATGVRATFDTLDRVIEASLSSSSTVTYPRTTRPNAPTTST